MLRSLSVPASIILLLLLSIPFISHAQAQPDLQATIRAAIAADPRTAGMSPVQIDAMVAALSQSAQKQGMSPNDITWRPISNTPAAQRIVIACGAFPTILCTLSYSLGFVGPDYTIPLWLFVASLIAILIIMLLRRQHALNLRAAAVSRP